MGCPHKEFAVELGVNRLEDGADVSFRAEVRITCTACSEPFVFAAPFGMHPTMPTTSLDRVTLRVPILPQSSQIPVPIVIPRVVPQG